MVTPRPQPARKYEGTPLGQRCDEAVNVLVARPPATGDANPVGAGHVPDDDALLVEAGRELAGLAWDNERNEAGLIGRSDDLVAALGEAFAAGRRHLMDPLVAPIRRRLDRCNHG